MQNLNYIKLAVPANFTPQLLLGIFSKLLAKTCFKIEFKPSPVYLGQGRVWWTSKIYHFRFSST